jgi:phage terminase large subunit-like protein
MAVDLPPGEHARDYSGIALEYAQGVINGEIVACKWVKAACARHLNDLQRAADGWTYHFDRWHGDDICDFIEKLPHIEGDWDTPTIRLEPPQIFILAVVFGWRKVADGKRRFSTVYIEMARKGAKSTLTAGVSLYCLTCEGEPGAQIVVGATTGEQAGKVFNPARRMVGMTPALRSAFELEAFAKSITCGQNGGFIQTINAKGKTQDGWNLHVGVLDELHAHRDRSLFDVIKSAFGARKNPLLWIITTAGFDTNGVCYEQRTMATKMLSGAVELDHLFAIIFTLDDAVLDAKGKVVKPADDPFDERVWIKANPMLGITPTLDKMRSDAADAKVSPREEGNFKTKNLNLWMNAASAWLNIAQWNACADPTLSWEDFKGLDCYVGGDLADKDDITAIVLAAFDEDDRLLIKPVFWLPDAVLKHPDHAQGRGPAPYRTWVQQEHLRLTEGDWVDHNAVEDQVREWLDKFAIRRVTFDQFAAAQAMASRLNEDFGYGNDPIAGILHKNAKNVTDPAKELEARVKAGRSRFRHDGNPVMTWMASNVVVSRRRDETILPIKETEMSPNKIDGIDATINALWPAIFGQGPQSSVYETRGLLEIDVEVV